MVDGGLLEQRLSVHDPATKMPDGQLAGAQRFDSLLDLLLQYSSDRHR